MASEIIVNTIKAPTTGANANKIIVGSGQELDASAGLVTPDGHVIQVRQTGDSTVQTLTSSGTWVATGLSVTFTPKYDDSLILIQANMAGEVYGGSNLGVGYAITKNGTIIFNSDYDLYNSSNNAQRIGKVTLFDAEVSGSVTARTYGISFRPMGAGTARNNYYGSPSRLFVWEIAQ